MWRAYLQAVAALRVAEVADHLVVEDIAAVHGAVASVHAGAGAAHAAVRGPAFREDSLGALGTQTLAVALNTQKSCKRME